MTGSLMLAALYRRQWQSMEIIELTYPIAETAERSSIRPYDAGIGGENMKPSGYDERKAAIHMRRGGQTPAETAAELGRSLAWVYKWQARFGKEGWQG